MQQEKSNHTVRYVDIRNYVKKTLKNPFNINILWGTDPHGIVLRENIS